MGRFVGAVISGTGAGDGNVIGFNGGAGVGFTDNDGSTTRILGNTFFGNAGPAIASSPAGPTLTAAAAGDSGTAIFGSVTPAAPAVRLEFFANPAGETDVEGRRYLGFAEVATNGGTATFTVTVPGAAAPGEKVTATATSLSGTRLTGTSNFSAPATAAADNQPPTLAPIPYQAAT